jgi:hypothetical protein
LQHFGEITKNILDEVEKVPYLVLSYATRINAEQALARGRQFKEKTLTVSTHFSAINTSLYSQLLSPHARSHSRLNGTPLRLFKSRKKLLVARSPKACQPTLQSSPSSLRSRWRRRRDPMTRRSKRSVLGDADTTMENNYINLFGFIRLIFFLKPYENNNNKNDFYCDSNYS